VNAKTKKKEETLLILQCSDFEIYRAPTKPGSKKKPVSDITDEELINTPQSFHFLQRYISIVVNRPAALY